MTLRERVDRGDIVFNYGAQVVYRNQGTIVQPGEHRRPADADRQRAAAADARPSCRRRPIRRVTVTPDVWFKLHYKALTIEFEGIGVFGQDPAARASWRRPDRAADAAASSGGSLASELRLYRDALFVGVETGGATGDQAEAPGQYLNYRWRSSSSRTGDHAINDFHFSPDYHVDQILFRHILGTVTNAVYIKPQAAYWFDLGRTRALGLNGASSTAWRRSRCRRRATT